MKNFVVLLVVVLCIAIAFAGELTKFCLNEFDFADIWLKFAPFVIFYNN